MHIQELSFLFKAGVPLALNVRIVELHAQVNEHVHTLLPLTELLKLDSLVPLKVPALSFSHG